MADRKTADGIYDKIVATGVKLNGAVNPVLKSGGGGVDAVAKWGESSVFGRTAEILQGKTQSQSTDIDAALADAKTGLLAIIGEINAALGTEDGA